MLNILMSMKTKEENEVKFCSSLSRYLEVWKYTMYCQIPLSNRVTYSRKQSSRYQEPTPLPPSSRVGERREKEEVLIVKHIYHYTFCHTFISNVKRA